MRYPTRWTPEIARRALADLDTSGDSLAAFSRRTGCSPQRVAYWRRQLAQPEAPAFVELIPTPAKTETELPAVEVRLPSGLILAVAAGVAGAQLVALLRTVEAAC